MLQGLHIDEYSGTKMWYKDGELHREDGPAIIWKNGDEEWYLNSKKHRDDGPAVYYPSFNGLRGWYIDGRKLSEDQFKQHYREIRLNNLLD